jgi:PAS domain S-box-containing protein
MTHPTNGTGQPPQALDQHPLQEQLQMQQERFEGIFDTSAIGMALVSTDGHWIKVNNALLQMLGYQREQLQNRTFQDITHPDDLQADLHQVSELLEGNKDSYQMEKRYFNSEGLVIWALLSVSVVRDCYRRPLHFVSQIIDITETKKLAHMRLAEMDRHDHHIAFELHENIAQTIASIKLYLSTGAAGKLYEGKDLGAVDIQLSKLVREITALSDRIMPSTFILENLYDLLSGLVVKYSVANNMTADLCLDECLKDLNLGSSYQLFRIIEDLLKLAALCNASFIRLHITRPGALMLQYSHNGEMPQSDAWLLQALLLNHIKTRVEIIEGTMHALGATGAGNEWSITIPWKHYNPDNSPGEI